MNNELYHVLSHPALGLQNWNTDAVLKFMRILNNVHEIQKTIDSYGLTKRKKSKYGVHYRECVWSRDDAKCGPDTCVCCSINWNKYNISRLLNEITSTLRPYELRSRSTTNLTSIW